MTKIPETFNFSQKENMDFELLLKELQRMYYELASALNRKPDVYQRSTDGQTTDTFLANGDMTINTTTNKVEMLTEHPTQTTVTWVTLS